MLWITRFQVGSAFQEYLPWQKQPSLQGYQSKGDGRSPHPTRGSYFISLLSWPGVTGWGEAGTPLRVAQRPSMFPSGPGSHVRVHHVNCPELGHVSKSPAILHEETPWTPKKNSSTKCQQRDMICVFSGFTLQLLLRQNNICNARDLWSNK